MTKESVWDYPRPPRVEPVAKTIRVEFNGMEIAKTTRALRVLETSHPPVYYIPQEDVRMDVLERAPGKTFCEWKGSASYWTVRVNGREAPKSAWTYAEPTPPFAAIKDHVAFYASRMDACYVDEEKVTAQQGDFYGGWITSNIEGPFKGGADSEGW